MSIKKAQKIVNDIHSELDINLVQFEISDLQFLKTKLEDFLEQEVEIENLADPSEPDDSFGLDDVEDAEDEEEEAYDQQ